MANFPSTYPFPVAAASDAKRGQEAGQPVFGEGSRYRVVPVHGRDLGEGPFISWFVSDAYTVTDADVRKGKLPQIVRQANSYEEAIATL